MWIGFVIVWLILYSDICYGLGEIAQKKCQEYAEYVYTMEESPVLSKKSDKNRVSTCGMVEVPLVIGGVKTKPKEFPHMVVVGYGSSVRDPKIEWKCGGTLISEDYVLTAAHCVNDAVAKAVVVRLGEVDFTSDDETDIQTISIAKKIKHPDYNADQRYNDIALIKLEEPANFNAYVRPACLYTSKTAPSIAVATGFGKTSYDAQDGSKFLMKVTLNIIPNADCKKYFLNEIQEGSLKNGLIESILCAGYLSGGRDTCQGDSGGPLQIALAEPYCMYSVAGVVSFGKFCGFANMPAIYTFVTEFIPWIENNVWKS